PPPAPAPAPERAVREPAPAAPPSPPAAPAADEVERLNAAWRELVAEVGKSAPLARQALLDAKPVGTSSAEVELGLDPEFAAHRETLEMPRNQKALNQALSRFLKREVRVRLSLLEAGATLPADAPADTQRSVMSRDAAQQWSADPAVKSILETFDGDITDIRA
ncbi:MAG: hypothetical protein K9N49_05880, partial [Candidatus Marinimicrobia bacterium]|nr:hypothetical protein [Candidatus Neomarinimicrobiota bacterium]